MLISILVSFVAVPFVLAGPIPPKDSIAAHSTSELVGKSFIDWSQYNSDDTSKMPWVNSHTLENTLPVEPDEQMRRREVQPVRADTNPVFAHLKPHTHIPAALQKPQLEPAENAVDEAGTKPALAEEGEGIARIRHYWDRPTFNSGRIVEAHKA